MSIRVVLQSQRDKGEWVNEQHCSHPHSLSVSLPFCLIGSKTVTAYDSEVTRLGCLVNRLFIYSFVSGFILFCISPSRFSSI